MLPNIQLQVNGDNATVSSQVLCQPMKEICAFLRENRWPKVSILFKHLKGWIECPFPLHHNQKQAEVALNYRLDYSLWIFSKCDQKGVAWRKGGGG